jgi:hyaluronate lyase
MLLEAVESNLTAKKSWFFFGDQIVALGSGITSLDGRPIETIVENAKLHNFKPDGKYALVVDGKTQPEALGWSADLKQVSWANLAGKVPGTDIGWVFPGKADLKVLREARTGNWRDSFVNDGDTRDHTRTFLTLWFDHGANPKGDHYAYILLPGRDAAQTAAYAQNPGVEIVENSEAAHAVRSQAMGITGANFWTDKAHRSGDIHSSGKAAVLVHTEGDTVRLAIADPTQLETSVEISWNGRVSKALQVDEAITVLSLNPLRVAVDLTQSDGRTFIGAFQK